VLQDESGGDDDKAAGRGDVPVRGTPTWVNVDARAQSLVPFGGMLRRLPRRRRGARKTWSGVGRHCNMEVFQRMVNHEKSQLMKESQKNQMLKCLNNTYLHLWTINRILPLLLFITTKR